MNTSESIINILLLFLLVLAIIIFLKNPRKILIEFIVIIKESRFPYNIIFLPIWGPIYLMDRIFRLKIFDENKDPVYAQDDIPYKCEIESNLNFDEFVKYLIINTSDNYKVFNTIIDFTELFQIKEIEYESVAFEGSIIIKLLNTDFLSSMYLIQWINQLADENDKQFIIGIFDNQNDKDKSFFAINDTTGKHINSLVGEDYRKNSFSIYLLDDFSKENYISYNNEICFDASLDLSKMISMLRKLKFEQACA